MASHSRSREDLSRSERATRILRENARPFERLVGCYARTDADRADLRQDVALALWSALPTFRGDCSERTFLLRVAHNRALTFLAKRGPRTEELEDHADRVVATTGKNPAIAYERKERESGLLSAVRCLPVPQRQLVMLLLEGLSHAEIASVLGTNENNVGVRANRARAALRVLMEEEGARS
ncbi:MAG: polymerase sigma-70 factor, subfamily protein [Labilithrix sp.]|nr:polymerase sigma-70 factor, subfamily protein [Labilithrix sp.]